MIQDVDIITTSLKKKPSALSGRLWSVLRRHKLLRTPEEQRRRLLPNSSFRHTAYSNGLTRILKAVLALDPRTKDLHISFRKSESAVLDCSLDGSHLLIDENWLDFDASHVHGFSGCRLFTDTPVKRRNIELFSCGHIVIDLYILILAKLCRAGDSKAEHEIPTDPKNNIYRKINEKILYMPQKVECSPGSNAGELLVSWEAFEADKNLELHNTSAPGGVVLHRESTCLAKKDELLVSGFDSKCLISSYGPNHPPSLQQITQYHVV
jgi:hypothetical protein